MPMMPLFPSAPLARRVRSLSIPILLVAGAGLFVAGSAASANVCYVLIEGVGGSPISALSGTLASGHADETKVESFGWNAYRPVDGALMPGEEQLQPVLRIARSAA